MPLLLKMGIVERGEVAVRALRSEKARQGWWPFSYTILSDMENCFSKSDEPLLDRLYQSMRGGQNVYKITKANRFIEIDRYILKEIGARFPPTSCVRIHDMAASNGITSLQLFSELASFYHVHLHASDYYDRLFIVKCAGSSWRVVFDYDFAPIQFVGWGLVLSAYRPEPARYLINRLIQTLVSSFVLPETFDLLLSESLDGVRGTLETSRGTIEQIPLIHPNCKSLAATERRFTFGHDDLFRPASSPYEIIRVMNALTPKHFEPAKVLHSVRLIARNLCDGGVLVLGRNVDEVDGGLAATAFERRRNRFVPLLDFGVGFEMKEPLLALKV